MNPAVLKRESKMKQAAKTQQSTYLDSGDESIQNQGKQVALCYSAEEKEAR